MTGLFWFLILKKLIKWLGTGKTGFWVLAKVEKLMSLLKKSGTMF